MFANILSQSGANGKQSVPPSKIEPVAVSTYHESDKTSFAKHLRWKMKTRDIEWMDITPSMAEEFLKYNSCEGFTNRPLSESTVSKYARLIKARLWGIDGNGTCEPLIVSDLPRLLSCQHRLAAIIKAGVPQRMLVVFGEPDGNFAFIDQGRRRTASDIFAINGVANFAMAAAAVRWLMSYEAGKTSGDYGAQAEASNQEAYDAYLRYPNLQESIKVGCKFGRDRLPAPAVAAAIHYLCAQKSRRAADEYFEKIASGIGFSRTREPAKQVRDFLTRSDAGRITRRMTASVLIQGWNAVRTNKSLPKTINTDVVGAIV